MKYSNHPVTKEYRQLLRKTETTSERILWKKLRGKKLDGFRFRQQRIHVLRIKNEEVETNIEEVLKKIRNYINSINRDCEVVQTPTP